ncbi:MAG: winged helix-turn-helix domain-containing protein [Chitinophagales bacterium]
MKDIIQNMDKAFDSRIRLGIMAILMVNEWVDFNTLKERLGVTDGNLASHTASLEKKGFIKVRKRFVKKRPNTSYQVSPLGKASFSTYLQSLKKLLNLKS